MSTDNIAKHGTRDSHTLHQYPDPSFFRLLNHAVRSMVILAVILFFGLIIVLIAPGVVARRVLGNREKLSDERLLELFNPSSRLPEETILMILKSIGSAYGIGYSKLRPNDCFVSQLSKIDSWRLDAGAEKIEGLLREKFGLAIPAEAKSFTLSNLMKLIELGK